MKKETVSAEVLISRTTSNHDPTYAITIRLKAEDEDWEVELTPEQFALALTGMGGISGELTRKKRNRK